MKSLKNYNIYVFISTFIRNIIDIYSIVFLYQKGFNIKNIFFIYILIYFLGSIISTISLYIGNKIGYKYILILSSIFTSISFYLLQNINNHFIISIFLSLSIFTYHPIRHYYGINLLKNKKEIGNNLIYNLLSITISSYIIIKKINFLYLTIISIISIIPILFLENNSKERIIYPKNISITKYNYFILDQFKIIFLLLEPLYLYLLSNKISYIGIYNIILVVGEFITIHFLSNKLNLNKYYKYLNLFFTIILLIKINLHNSNILLIISFLEGIGIKTNELVSTINLYNNKIKGVGYLIISEIIFTLTRTIILSIFYLLNLSLKSILYILIFFIFFLSFSYKEKRY